MKYRELLNNITEVAKKHPNINSTFIGDVYELNHRNDVDYCAFVITQGTHRVNSDEDYIDYTLNLFYVDRLTADESNRTQIHSSGIDFMNSLLKAVEKLGVVVVEHTENVFNERFNDCCAGVYATVVFRVDIDECGQTIEIITPDELKVLEVTKNGIYNGLFKEVDVNVQGGGKEPVLETLNVKDNGTYRPNTGVDGFDIVEVNIPKEIHNVVSKSITANGKYNSEGDDVWNEVTVNVPQKTFNKTSLTKEYTANGQYSIATPDGYDGISDVSVNVNVPSREPVLESLSVIDNGTYTPESGIDGYNSVEVNVPKEIHNVTSKSITENGVYNSEGNDVWNSVDVNVPERQPVLDSLSVTDNGTYTPSVGVDGYNSVEVNVPKEIHNVTSKSINANGTYNSTGDEVWNEVSVNVPQREPVLESLSVTDNGNYTPSAGKDGFDSVDVNVPKEHHNVVSKSITANGVYNSTGDDVWNSVDVNVPERQPVVESLSVTENGIYNAPSGVDGYNTVSVNVPQKTFNKASVTKEYTANGQYSIATPDGYDGISDVNLTVNVPSREPVLESLSITENGTYTPSSGVDGYNKVSVNVPQSGGTGLDFNQLYGVTFKTNGTTLDLTGLDTSTFTSMNSMFKSCGNLTSLDVSHFDTSNVTDMFSMFYDCGNLTSLDVSHFDTSKVKYMNNMFYNCYRITSLNLSGWNTSKVTDINNMFANCNRIASLDLSGFNLTKVRNPDRTFYNCFELETIITEGLQLPDTNMYNIELQYSTKLTVDSIVGLLNALPQSTNNYSFRIGDTNIAKLSEEQKAIATTKGWRLV